jgi:hypothetical protein
MTKAIFVPALLVLSANCAQGQAVPDVDFNRHTPIIFDAQRTEREHSQARLLAELRPSIYSDDGLTVTLRDAPGGLGRIDPQDMENPEAVGRLLTDLAPLTGVQGNEEFQVDFVRKDSEERFTISYRQVVHGIPVGTSREVIVSAHGRVDSLVSTVVDPARLPEVSTRMTDEAALETAIEALESEFGASGGFEYQHFSEQDSLAYRIVSADWAPIWRSVFSVSSNSSSGGYWVSVNVVTGTTVIVSTDFN